MKALILSLVFVATTVACLSQTAQTFLSQPVQTLPAWTKEAASIKKAEKQQNDQLIIITCTYIVKTTYKNGNSISGGSVPNTEADKIANKFGYRWVDTSLDKVEDSFFTTTKNGTQERYQKMAITIYGTKK